MHVHGRVLMSVSLARQAQCAGSVHVYSVRPAKCQQHCPVARAWCKWVVPKPWCIAEWTVLFARTRAWTRTNYVACCARRARPRHVKPRNAMPGAPILGRAPFRSLERPCPWALPASPASTPRRRSLLQAQALPPKPARKTIRWTTAHPTLAGRPPALHEPQSHCDWEVASRWQLHFDSKLVTHPCLLPGLLVSALACTNLFSGLLLQFACTRGRARRVSELKHGSRRPTSGLGTQPTGSLNSQVCCGI